MNPYLIVAALLGCIISGVAGTGYGIRYGRNTEIAKQASEEVVRQKTFEAAQQGAAAEIAKLKPVNTTIRAKTETIIRENNHYRTCVNDPSVMRNINSAIAGSEAQPSGGQQLPKAPASK